MTISEGGRSGLDLNQLARWFSNRIATGPFIIIAALLYPMLIGSLQTPPIGYELPIATWLWDLLVGLGMAGTLFLVRVFRLRTSFMTNMGTYVIAALVGSWAPIAMAGLNAKIPDHILAAWPIVWISNFGLLVFFLIFISAFSEFRFSNRDLAEKSWRLSNRKLWLEEELSSHTDMLTDELASTVGPRLRQTRGFILDSNFYEAQYTLNRLIEDVIRPTSQFLDSQEFVPEPRPAKRMSLSATATHVATTLNRRFPIRAVLNSEIALAFSLIFLAPASFVANSHLGVISITVFLFFVYLGYALARQVFQNHNLSFGTLLVVNLTLSGLISVGYIVFASFMALKSPSGLGAFIALGLFLTFASSGYVSMYLVAKLRSNQEAKELAAELVAAVGELQIRMLAARRRLGLWLHGEFQAQLQAILIPLSKQIVREVPDVDGFLRSLESVESLFSEISTVEYAPTGLRELANQWEGVCDVRLHVTPETLSLMDSSPGISEVVQEICRERVVNAVKHSGAEYLEIRIEREPGEIVIRTKNEHPGDYPQVLESQGLGTAFMNRVCSNWELKFQHSQVIFCCKLPHP